jgi:hypothetical protein
MNDADSMGNDHQPFDMVRLSSPHPEEDAVTFSSEPPPFFAGCRSLFVWLPPPDRHHLEPVRALVFDLAPYTSRNDVPFHSDKGEATCARVPKVGLARTFTSPKACASRMAKNVIMRDVRRHLTLPASFAQTFE